MTLLVAIGVCAAALLLDQFLGEPRKFHPLVGFGSVAQQLEQRLNRGGDLVRLLTGMLALVLIVVIPVGLLMWLQHTLGTQFWLLVIIDLIVMQFVIGWQSLRQHARAVASPLQQQDLSGARQALSMIVSRDTQHMTSEDISGSTIESVLENGHDSVFASLFWYLIAGSAGALVHRLVNTLDAMWGYRNERFNWFGKTSAGLDDLMGWAPARLTALSYAVAALDWQHFQNALTCWRSQGNHHKSPNGGPVMASGAAALGIRIGGPMIYEGQKQDKPWLGDGQIVAPKDIERSIGLVNKSIVLWLTASVLVTAVAITSSWFY